MPRLRSGKLPLTRASCSQTSADCTLPVRGPRDPEGNHVEMEGFGKLQRASRVPGLEGRSAFDVSEGKGVEDKARGVK